MNDGTDKVRENRLRRVASRRGLIFDKARRIDRGATDYGLIRLRKAPGEEPVFESKDLDAIEKFLG